MKKVLLIASVALLAMSVAVAQNAVPTSDVLGAHQNGGRGCAGCHTPHSGAFGAGQLTTDTTSGNQALWGQDMTPIYGATFIFGNESDAIGTKVTAASGWNDVEGKGLVMCLSCHDGNLTKTNMMAGVSYEQKMGILPAVYGNNPIPTLLGADGTTPGNYLNDHPVGKGTPIDPKDWIGTGVTWAQGPVKNGNPTVALTVAAGSNYANFQQVYSNNALSNMVTDGTNYFPVCTTCHNQHIMNIAKAKVGGVAGTYNTFFFVRDPYNPGAQTMGAKNVAGVSQSMASSATQFCRQCHFGDSNEANGALPGTIPTAF